MEGQELGKRLCVIGAGATGLVTTKNFLEVGFDVTTYERHDYVGGLWHVTDDPDQTSVFEGTRANLSKHGVSRQFTCDMGLLTWTLPGLLLRLPVS